MPASRIVVVLLSRSVSGEALGRSGMAMTLDKMRGQDGFRHSLTHLFVRKGHCARRIAVGSRPPQRNSVTGRAVRGGLVVGEVILALPMAIFERHSRSLKDNFGSSIETMAIGMAIILSQLADEPSSIMLLAKALKIPTKSVELRLKELADNLTVSQNFGIYSEPRSMGNAIAWWRERPPISVALLQSS